MKRVFPFLLILLLLTGCSSQPADQSATQETTPVNLDVSYNQNSSVEASSEGAIKQYSLTGQMDTLNLIDAGLILSNDQGKLGLLTEKDSFLTYSDVNGLLLLSAQNEYMVLYGKDDHKIYIANNSFAITDEFALEEGITGLPVYGTGTHEIYYCVSDYIRAMDLETGLSRHVIQHVQENQSQINCYFDGAVIGREHEGKSTYISSVDGQTVFSESSLRDFTTTAQQYYGIYRDGFVDQYIWGDVDSDPLQLLLSSEELVYPQMIAQCVVSFSNCANGTILRRYDMISGRCVGSVEFKMEGNVVDVVSDDSATWVLTDEMLYCWDFAVSSNIDERVYTAPLITAENPDSEAIEQLRGRADAIAAAYGVEIHIWDDTPLYDETYDIVGEYQVGIIERMLDELEAWLPTLPVQIFKPTEEYCGIQISLVRSIDGLDFVQFWDEGGLCIAITPEADIQEALLTGLGWGIDSRVIGNSRDLDYWNDLNPDGFNYDYSYFVNAQRNDLQYLENEKRAFTDQRAMSFPSEDRARIFYYSMLEDNSEIFASDIMQAKLKTFCEGIREAYGWQKESESFAWEQYLKDSIAYNK